jgi:hypothetical protein
MSDEMTDEDKVKHEMWTVMAIALGYNELAKAADVLGEKVWFRLARDNAEAQFIALGGYKVFTDEANALEIQVPGAPFYVKFRKQDIEAMRAVVAAHDAGTPDAQLDAVENLGAVEHLDRVVQAARRVLCFELGALQCSAVALRERGMPEPWVKLAEMLEELEK